MFSNDLVIKIKKIFNLGNINQIDELNELIKKLYNYIIYVNTKYNIYTSINKNFVEDVLIKFKNHEREIFFYSLKDAFFKKNYVCAAASQILSTYVANIDSEVARVLDNNYVFVGMTNCDEFCCGSYGLNSFYGSVVYDDNLPIGGSSSGASIDCMLNISDISIGTDTGGSCRFPAKLVGCYGFKPTYGTISRFGLISYAQSLDVVGFITKSLYCLEKSLYLLFCYHQYDSCMIKLSYLPYKYQKKIRVVIIDAYKMCKIQLNFLKQIEYNSKFLIFYYESSLNINLIYVVYEILSSVELFSSLNRYDRIKYDKLNTLESLDIIYEDRFKYLGANIKGKIMQGALFLHSKDLREYYYMVLQQRSNILYSFLKFFTHDELCNKVNNDTIVITPDVNNVNDHTLECYQILSNLSGCPCLCIPMKTYNATVSRDKYVSLLVHGNMKNDNLVIYFAKETEKYA